MGAAKKGIYVFAGIILSLFAVTTAYFAGSVAVSVKNGPVRAERDFTRISQDVNSVLFFDLNEERLRDFQNKTVGDKYLAALLVRSGRDIVFAYPSSSHLIVPDALGMPSLKTSSPFIKVFSTTVSASSKENTVLTAAVYTLHPSDIYNPARLSFLVVLACTLSVFAVLIYLSVFGQGAEYEAEKTAAQTEFFPNPAERESIAVHMPTLQPQTASYAPVPESAEPEIAADFEPPLYAQTVTERAPSYPEPDGTGTAFAAPADAEELPAQDRISEPTGLFSPATGVGWESYMETRLDSELVRAASSEQDLALVLLRIPGLENNSLMMKRIAAVLLDFFKFRDFVFEYKKDGFAGILLNINLDQAMVLSETMHTQLKELLESENIREKLAIGISTRSLRILPGSRLISEANQALEKAFGETGLPIVAFRVNPDKYRQFVADATQRV